MDGFCTKSVHGWVWLGWNAHEFTSFGWSICAFEWMNEYIQFLHNFCIISVWFLLLEAVVCQNSEEKRGPNRKRRRGRAQRKVKGRKSVSLCFFFFFFFFFKCWISTGTSHFRIHHQTTLQNLAQKISSLPTGHTQTYQTFSHIRALSGAHGTPKQHPFLSVSIQTHILRPPN